MTGFVDVHSHMVPSGDDGVKSVEEGLELLRETAERGTSVQYATPHVNRIHPLTGERLALVQAAVAEMKPRAARFGLELRLGFELSPEPWLLEANLRDLRMEALDACLLELPLSHAGAQHLGLLSAAGRRMEEQGLRPILAHPERCPLVWDDPDLVRPFAERGWLLQINASSLLGAHGAEEERSGWQLIGAGLCDLVASDGHRAARPPYLDAAYAAVAAAAGEAAAQRLLRGEALEELRRAA